MSDIYKYCLDQYKVTFGKDLENNTFTYNGIMFVLHEDGYFQHPAYVIEPHKELNKRGKWKLTVNDIVTITEPNIPDLKTALKQLDF